MIKKSIWWLLSIIMVFIIYGAYLIYQFDYKKLEDFAQFGDSFGVLTSLFAGLTFIGLLITIHLQKQEIKEMQNNAKQDEFEKKFFYFLNIHNDLVSKFRQIYSFDNKKHYMYGGEAISFFLDKFKDSIEENYQEDIINPETLKIHISYKLMRNNLKFIDNIYILLELIDNKKLLKEKKTFYLNSILAQISDEELILIFYYTHAFREDMKHLINKFAFFKNIDEQLLHNWEEEIKFYKQEAYGKRGVLYDV